MIDKLYTTAPMTDNCYESISASTMAPDSRLLVANLYLYDHGEFSSLYHSFRLVENWYLINEIDKTANTESVPMASNNGREFIRSYPWEDIKTVFVLGIIEVNPGACFSLA